MIYPHKCALNNLKKKEKLENVYLKVKNVRASRALRWESRANIGSLCLPNSALLHWQNLGKNFLPPPLDQILDPLVMGGRTWKLRKSKYCILGGGNLRWPSLISYHLVGHLGWQSLLEINYNSWSQKRDLKQKLNQTKSGSSFYFNIMSIILDGSNYNKSQKMASNSPLQSHPCVGFTLPDNILHFMYFAFVLLALWWHPASQEHSLY